MLMTEPLSPSIFRAYDIRGIVGETLTPAAVFAIGQGLGTFALEQGDHCMVVGRDGRLSGPELSKALCQGILATGCDVIDLGMVPTPVLYYAIYQLKTRSGVMLTGSHNPPEYNGLKMMIHGKTLADEGIQTLYQKIIQQDFRKGSGQFSEYDIVEQYIAQIVGDIKLERPLKIVVDAGNGIAGKIVPTLYRRLGCEVHELFCEVDGRFPNHHPDPSQADNLQDLIHAVKTYQADIGLAFDGDGDRLGVVTNHGDIIWPDRQLILFAEEVLANHPGATIIYDVKCTYHLAFMIRKYGGNPLMWKTGHSFIKSKLAETNAKLAGEMSGHLFFNDRWYGFDDALYAGARLLNIVANESRSVSELFNDIPDSVNTPELKIHVTDDEKFLLMQRLIESAQFDADVITIDGLRVNFADGWGLVRPSNTTPCLVLRFEADNHSVLKRIQDHFRQLLLTVKPELLLPF